MFEQTLSLELEETNYSVSFRLPWYRALPMSCVQSMKALGGNSAATHFELLRGAGGEVLIPGSEQWWSPFDDSKIVFSQNPGPLEAIELSLRIPYHGAPPEFEQITLRFSFEGFGQ